jgi:hypothetical protein
MIHPRLIHKLTIRLLLLDEENSEYDNVSHTWTKKVYSETPIEIQAQPGKDTKLANILSTSIGGTSMMKENTAMYFLVQASDVYNEDGTYKIKSGAFVKEIVDRNRTIPVNAYVSEVRPVSSYGFYDLVRLYVEDRVAASPKDETGKPLKAQANVYRPRSQV